MIQDRRTQERRHSERRAIRCTSDPRWQGSANIIGYSIEAFDGPLGTVEAYCAEEESSVVTDLMVAAAAGSALVPISAIARIDEEARKVYLSATREQIGAEYPA